MVQGRVTIRLLGGFELDVSGRTVPRGSWRRRRAAELVKMLALAPDHRLPREVVIEALWPAREPSAGGRNLRKAAYHARRTLDDDEAVVLTGGVVELFPAADVTTDVAQFESAARDALRDPDPQTCRDAARLYGGELLPDDRYASWCGDRRERLRASYLRLLREGRLWGRMLEVDVANEHAHREIVRERLEAGDRAGAIHQFDRMRTALREELGVSPDPESVALYERVLAYEGRDVPTPAERARALLLWGAVHWERSALEEAERTALEVRALAVDAGLGRELAEASELLGLVAYAQDRWSQVFMREFVGALTHRPELSPFIFDANLCMSEFALHEPDGVHLVAELGEELLDVVDGSGAVPILAQALGLLMRGESGLLRGADPSMVAEDLDGAVQRNATAGSLTGRALATERLAQLEAATGHHDLAGVTHREALQLSIDSAVPQHLMPLVYGGMLAESEADVALEVLEEAEAVLDGRDLCPPCSMSYHVAAATLHARHDALERAQGHLEAAERIAQMWQDGPWHAAVLEARSAIRRAEGADTREVASLLRAAADGFADGHRPRDEARCREAIAELG